MAYSASNPPRLLSGAFVAGGAPSLWAYSSTDAAGAVDAITYFTNASDLGMKVGDLVIVEDTATVLVTMHQMHAVVASSGGDLGTGISIGSSANAD